MKKQRKLTRKQCTKRFFAACLKWRNLLQLHNYELWVSVTDLEQSLGKNFRINADNTGQVKYMQIRITGDFTSIQNMNDIDLDDLACHEVIHSTIAPISELLDEVIKLLPKTKQEPYNNWQSREVEGVTSHLTCITQALHRAPKGKQK